MMGGDGGKGRGRWSNSCGRRRKKKGLKDGERSEGKKERRRRKQSGAMMMSKGEEPGDEPSLRILGRPRPIIIII